jgi:hypothetical protein
VVVEQYLWKEWEVRYMYMVRPLHDPVAGLCISQFGGLNKPHLLRKWHLIVNLSHPKAKSVSVNVGEMETYYGARDQGLIFTLPTTALPSSAFTQMCWIHRQEYQY